MNNQRILFQDVSIFVLSQAAIIAGNYTFRVLKGTLDVSGAYFPASAEFFSIFNASPPYYVLKPHALSNSFCLLQEFYPTLEDNLTAYPLIIEVREINISHLGDLSPPLKALSGRGVSLLPLSNNIFNIFDSWASTESTINDNSSMLLIGPKDSGKSSFARYIYNKRVSLRKMVYFLEFDPGQCEFCPPGTLSLHKLESTMLGPSWSHCDFKYCIKSHSFGLVSPAETPELYLDICTQLYETWLSIKESNSLLIINTPGWTKGLGLELNIDLIRITNPSHILHMGQDDSSSELQQIFGDRVKLVDACPESASRFSSAELRNFQTLAYFHWSNYSHLTNWAPYELCISDTSADISVIHALALQDSYGIDFEDFDILFEGTIVSLVSAQGDLGIFYSTHGIPLLDLPTTQKLHSVAECIGYAIVQSINLSRKTIRILTPEDPGTFKEDRKLILCRGRLVPSLWQIWDQKMVDIPFVSSQSVGIGAVYSKFRRNIARK